MSPSRATASSKQTVELTVTASGTNFSINNDSVPQSADDLLYRELAWRDPDAEFTRAYKNGDWDGYYRLYDRTDHTGPVGLLDRAADLLEANGYTVTITDNHQPRVNKISLDWDFDHQLREYQRTAVDATIENQGGIVAIPTGGGKTVVALRLLYELQRSSVIFVHTKTLLHQWADRIEDILGVTPGKIGDGSWKEKPITVATMQTVHERGADNLDDYDVAVFDECHRTSAAETMYDIGLEITPELRIGLSATPWRRIDGEELRIEGAVGSEAINIQADTLVDQGYLAEPTFEFLHIPDQRIPSLDADYRPAFERTVIFDPARNEAIAEKVAELADNGERVLVSVNRIDHGRILEYLLTDETKPHLKADLLYDQDDIPRKAMKEQSLNELSPVSNTNAAFLCGKDTTNTREETIAAFENGETNILISTLLKEGADIPSISALVVAEGGKSKTEKIQRIGRALRPENGDEATIVDVQDQGGYFAEHYQKRLTTYNDYYGKYAPQEACPEDKRVETVENYLKEYNVPVDKLDVTRQENGDVHVTVDAYLQGNQFDNFRQAVNNASGMQYDGTKNICSKDWIENLPH